MLIINQKKQHQKTSLTNLYMTLYLWLTHKMHYYWMPLSGHTQLFIWVFGSPYRKTVSREREDTRVWHQETMFSEVVSYCTMSPCTDPCTNIFCTSPLPPHPPPPPQKPRSVANQLFKAIRS